jgi:hypothetical protein
MLIGFITYRNDKGDITKIMPMLAELPTIDEKGLAEIGLWICKQYKSDKQMTACDTAIKSDCE